MHGSGKAELRCCTNGRVQGLKYRDPGIPNTGIPVYFFRFSNAGIHIKYRFSVQLKKELFMICLYTEYKIENNISLALMNLQLTDFFFFFYGIQM